MASESIRTYNPEKTSRIKTEIESAYCRAQEALDAYLHARKIHIGNESIYYHSFIGAFQSLVARTRMDAGIKTYKLGKDVNRNLLGEVDTWLANGSKHIKWGIFLFQEFCQALFDSELLSLRGQ